MPVASINGLDLYFERHGDDGEPLVLVHGYTGDVTDWRFQVQEFAPTHRVLVMDHRGHGRSTAPDRSRYSIEAMADDVESLAAEVGFERYHLVGHSMGGCVSQEIALRSAGRLMSLTLHDTGPLFGFGRNEVVAKYAAMREQMAEQQGMRAVADLPGLLARPPHFPPERAAEEKERLARMSLEGFIGAWSAMNAWPGTRERAHTIATPTLVIYGALDVAVLKGSAWLGENIPGAVVEIVPEAGHSPQYERPDIFNAALRRHLDHHAGAVAK